MQPPYKVADHSYSVDHYWKMLSVVMYSLPDSGVGVK